MNGQEMDRRLIAAAFSARENAYVPYSRYAVGAALLTGSGCIYTGCNIESASYGATNCAERTAVFKAVSEGERRITAIAIAGGRKSSQPPLSDFAPPCGICRQVLAEFASGELRIILARSQNDYRIYTLDELLPLRFGNENL